MVLHEARDDRGPQAQCFRRHPSRANITLISVRCMQTIGEVYCEKADIHILLVFSGIGNASSIDLVQKSTLFQMKQH